MTFEDVSTTDPEAPSANWSRFSDLATEKPGRIKYILSSADFEYLEMQALRLRQQQEDLSVDIECRINRERCTSGYYNIILEVAFTDGVYWIARVPYRHVFSYTVEDTRISLLSEIATLKVVHERTSIPVPQIFGFETTDNQPFGHPYVLMEYMPGRTLERRLVLSVPPAYHSKVAKQMANVLFELQKLTFDKIGLLWSGETANEDVTVVRSRSAQEPFCASLEYFHNRLRKPLSAASAHQDDAEWITACWMLKLAPSFTTIVDKVRGPFPLCHLDLHYGNLLFDNEYNLTGVIDWSHAYTAPIEELAICPEFVTFPSGSAEGNRAIEEFKSLALQYLRELEKAHYDTQESSRHSSADVEKSQSGNQGLAQHSLIAGEEAHLTDGKQLHRQQQERKTPLSTFMASIRAEVAYRFFTVRPNQAKMFIWTGQQIAKAMYGDAITWEQLKATFGTMPIF